MISFSAVGGKIVHIILICEAIKQFVKCKKDYWLRVERMTAKRANFLAVRKDVVDFSECFA